MKIKLITKLSVFFLINYYCSSSFLVAQESFSLKEIEINSSTKSDGDNNLDLPSNPFALVEMMRRANSLNDATKPSDAIDDALRSFDMIREKEKY
tara:strand:- start:173 stop:457 length:285 start_codon:yes stop_codon:yes gene_type:complete